MVSCKLGDRQQRCKTWPSRFLKPALPVSAVNPVKPTNASREKSSGKRTSAWFKVGRTTLISNKFHRVMHRTTSTRSSVWRNKKYDIFFYCDRCLNWLCTSHTYIERGWSYPTRKRILIEINNFPIFLFRLGNQVASFQTRTQVQYFHTANNKVGLADLQTWQFH